MAINKCYIAYFSLRMRETRNGRISTFGLKSDVTIGFLDPDFLLRRLNLGDSRTFKADILLLNICMGFQHLLAKNGGFGGQNRGRGGAILTLNELVLTFRGSYVCANFGENRSRNATVRVLADGQTDTHTDANRFYNLSHAICYSYGTDNK